ncbi:MAG: type II secretion system F family protein [Planctomycetota bacterium]|jgi:type II secretory pathway component PulF
MLTYSYKAKNISGNELSGQIQAQSRNEVVAALKQKGLFLLKVVPQNRLSAAFASGSQMGRRVSIKDKAIFTHQLATLLKAGMKLTVALNTLSKQTKNKHLKTVISKIHDDIEQSSSLSESMARHPKIFSRVYTAVIEAAEQSGALSETLSVLSIQLKSQASVSSRIKSALVYPIFLLAVSALVVGVLMTFVIPKFIELFVNANQKLPVPTKILISITETMKGSWWVVVLVIVAAICTITTALKNRRFKLIFDSLLLNLPVAGTLNSKLQIARFARTLGSLLNGGVRILTAVQTTRGTTNNIAFADDISGLEQKILKGSTLAEAMTSQKYFSEIASNMVAVGEETGALPEMLLELADMYDNESETAIGSMTTLLGPLMIVILGLIIGFVVFAILMPIFETSTMVG